MDDEAKGRELRVGGSRVREEIDLRELGFVNRVSEAARNEIVENEIRASMVMTTASRFAFR